MLKDTGLFAISRLDVDVSARYLPGTFIHKSELSHRIMGGFDFCFPPGDQS
jgi:hypothetical protein